MNLSSALWRHFPRHQPINFPEQFTVRGKWKVSLSSFCLAGNGSAKVKLTQPQESWCPGRLRSCFGGSPLLRPLSLSCSSLVVWLSAGQAPNFPGSASHLSALVLSSHAAGFAWKLSGSSHPAWPSQSSPAQSSFPGQLAKRGSSLILYEPSLSLWKSAKH